MLNGRVILTQKETPKQASKNRSKNTRKIATKTGYERDEAPPASSYASRNGSSSVRLILRDDNQAHGKDLKAFYKEHGISTGDWFIYE